MSETSQATANGTPVNAQKQRSYSPVLGKVGLRTNIRRGRGDAVVALDKRSRLAKDVARFKQSLFDHVGNNPSAVQRHLIDLCAQLHVRMLVMDGEFTETGTMADYDSRMYLSWANSLARTLARLGLKGAPPARQSLSDYLNRRDAAPDEPQTRPRHRLGADARRKLEKPQTGSSGARLRDADADDEG